MGLFNRPSRNPAPTQVEPEAPKQPEPLTRADVETMVKGAVEGTASQLTGVIAELRQGIESLAGRAPAVIQQQVAAAPIEHQITDEEIDNAVASGQGASQVVRRLLDKQARDIHAGVEQRIRGLEEFGTRALGGLQVEKLQTRKHYARFKKEIDQKIGMLPDAYKANPDTIDLIYKSVVGEHEEELTREAHEAALRNAADGGTVAVKEVGGAGVGKPGGSVAGRTETAKAPTAEEFAGKEGLNALQHKERGGNNPDAFAQSLGYESWSAYIAQYDKLRAEQGDL